MESIMPKVIGLIISLGIAYLIYKWNKKHKQSKIYYAIANIKANWNKNALHKAKEYQEEQNMSPDAIYDQLTSDYGEQFTPDEANYAIQHLEK